MHLVLSRSAAAGTLLVAAALAATLTTVLLTAFVLYAQLLPVAATRTAILEAPADQRTLRVTASAGDTEAELADRDAAVRGLFAGGLAGVPLAVSSGGYASGQELPPGLVPEQDAAVVAFLPDLPAHAELVGGSWPEPDGDPIEAAVPVPVADQLGLEVGDELGLVDRRSGESVPAPVRVVGVWEPSDPSDPYWRLAAAPVDRGGWGPFVVHEDAFVAGYQQLAIVEWLAVPDPARLAEAGMERVRADVDALAAELIERRESDPALDESTRFVRTGFGELAERLAVAAVVNRSGLVLPAALLVVIAGYGLVLLAQLLAAHRRGENALLRARGASRRQLVRFTVAEALLVVAPAAVLGAPVGSWLVRVADARVGGTGAGLGAAARGAGQPFGIAGDLARHGLVGPPLAWLVAVVAAVGCATALALPVAGRGRTWVAEQQERSRPSRAATLQRAGVDVALVGLAVLAWLQLRQYGSAVAPTEAGLGVDPLLVAAPVVGVLAATAVTLRLLPLATRWGVRVAARRDGLAGLLGMWQADRRPHAGPVLLLVLAVATAVLAPAVATTWQQSQRDQATQRVGADLRASIAIPARSSGSELAAAAPAATAMPVHRDTITLTESAPVPLLALDSDRAAQVARLRPDLSRTGPDELFATLRQGRPELAGLPLPAGARRLVGRFRFTAPEPETYRFLQPVTQHTLEEELVPVRVRLDQPRPDRLVVYVRDADGIVRSVPVGQRVTDAYGFQVPAGGIELDQGGELALDVALPPGTTALVGLGAGVSARGWDPWLIPDDQADPVPVSWHWEDLRVVDEAGAATPLALPDDWAVHRGGEPEPERVAGADLAVRATLEPFEHYPLSDRFLLTAPPPELSSIPVLVTPDVLADTGRQVGDTIQVDDDAGGLASVRLAGVVEAVPGTADGAGAMLDLAWFSTHQLLWQRRPPLVTEWWLATADPGPVREAVAALPWVESVADRRVEAQRLLEDPQGTGVLVALWAAAGAAALLAAFGLVVDSRATAVRRRRELAVLHTLGASPPALARALVVEQAVLAGLGVAAGVLVGVGVAAAMGTSLVLTPAGQAPVPAPLLTLSPSQLAAPSLGLLAAAVGLGAVVARRARREIAAGALRIGED